MLKFKKADIKAAGKSIQKTLKKEKGHPKTIKIKDSKGKERTLTKPEYAGLFEQRNLYIHKHRKSPAYVTLNVTANNPLILNRQDNSHTCCPTSLSMGIQCLYGYAGEKKCAEVLGTNEYGTSPSKLINNAPKLGYTVKRIPRNWKSVNKEIQKGFPVIIHYETAGDARPKCMDFINNYGHYMLCYNTTKKNLRKYYKVADPTKGFKTCQAKEIDKALNGRDLGYYVIKPK